MAFLSPGAHQLQFKTRAEKQKTWGCVLICGIQIAPIGHNGYNMPGEQYEKIPQTKSWPFGIWKSISCFYRRYEVVSDGRDVRGGF